MSPRRFACVCSRWAQRREMLLVARSLSGPAKQEGITLTELAEKPLASTTEPLFGIAARKLRNEEDEDFVSSSTFGRPQDGYLAPSHQNYFSQTWAEQRSLPKAADSWEEQSDPLSKHVVSPISSLKQNLSNQTSAPSRVWLVASDLQASTQETFTFISFKVLAMQVALKHRSQLFGHVPSGMLAWQNRSRKILAGLEQCSADIICLQEVDRFTELRSELSRKGYAWLYKASTGRESLACAIFWRQERFQLLHEESLEFRLLGMKDNVAQLCVLQSTVPGTPNMGACSNLGNQDPNQRKHLIVGNIDIFFNPKRGHIKLGQCRAFLEQAHKLSILWPDAPLIIGGCFHLTPQSGLYKFLTNSRLDVHDLEGQYLSGQLQTPASSSRIGSKHSGYINVTSSGNTEPSSDLSNRLRKSLLAKFASKQETDALDFANSAKELLSSTSSTASPSAPVVSNRHIAQKDEHTLATRLSSKTIEILESSTKSSQSTLRSMATNVSEVDVVPTSSSKVMDSSSTLNEVSTEACHSINTGGAEVSCDNAEPSNKTRMDECNSADLPERVALDHGWDPEELKLATGSVGSTVATHELKLFSIYPEIAGNSRTRDNKGEPHITMCHKEFRGTVDYIWRSKGLKTAKVFDTFSLMDMVTTPALPFIACGSDHVLLACELAFSSQ